MKDFEVHSEAMFQLIKAYALTHGLADQMSALLIVREVPEPSQPGQAQPQPADQPGTANLRMTIQGEKADIALGTLHYAAQVLVNEVRQAAAKVQSEPTA